MTTRLYDPTTTGSVVRGILIVTMAVIVVGFLALVRATMSTSDGRHPTGRGGIEGHQWSLHRNSSARRPCRIVCQCGWASSAGDHTSVLLQVKGHLEDCLHNGARLITSHQLPPTDPRQ
jgi:hypothetical protein